MKNSKRKLNEKKFKFESQTETKTGRIYKKTVKGKFGWKAEYAQAVNENENTMQFYLLDKLIIKFTQNKI